MGFLENIGTPELIVLVLIALFIFGPERLPKAIGEGLRMLRTLRGMARNATSDLSREMGTTIELEDLHPKTFLRKHLLSEDDERALRRPLESIYEDFRDVSAAVTDAANIDPIVPASRPAPASPGDPASGTSPHRPGRSRAFDADAT